MTSPQAKQDEAASPVNLQAVLKSQYHAALAMLKQAIDQCPEDLWTTDGDGHARPVWDKAYHTLFFTHFYLQKDQHAFKPWKDDREAHHRLGKDMSPPYQREEVLAYWDFCDAMVNPAVDELDLTASESGFPWYDPMGKLEHQFVNIRHIQHHTAQLIDRIRYADPDAQFRWIGGKPEQ